MMLTAFCLAYVNNDKDIHKDMSKDKDNERRIRKGSCIVTLFCIKYIYMNIIYEITFAETKTKTKMGSIRVLYQI